MNLEAKAMSLNGLGIAYFVLGCLLPALVAELYYLLWWKKRRTHTEIEVDQTNYAKGFLSRFFWKTPSSLHTSNTTPMNVTTKAETKSNEADLELGLNLKAFGEESVESELMRLHNLAGPPRFLFTINEETKEDLESEDGKSRCETDDCSRKGSRSKSLSDLMAAIDTSFHSINPLFEASAESELSRLRSSPPPTFKFLRDAEEKLYRRMIEEAQKNTDKNRINYGCVSESEGPKNGPNSDMVVTDYRDGSFLRLIKSKEREFQHVPLFPSSSSQVLPLASSPTTFKPLENISMC